ncbi:nicotinate (nicotinamide) nucleotide adenylyltransferase [Pseudomonadales bacterium]|nr:nicotinate (nicotinamide) nucleotide adenylyltransferase [Pseudomonadales bacterium]
MNKRIGVLGGSFDPVHSGHIASVLELAKRFDFEHIKLLPVGQHALKQAPLALAAHRKAMLDLAVRSYPQLIVDDRELRREGASYTIDTCCELRSELGDEATICFIVGSDVLGQLHLWQRWEELLGVVNLVVMRRAGISANELIAPEVKALLGTSVAQIDRPYGQLASVSLGEYPISSTQLRRELVQRNDVTSSTEALNACHLWQQSLPADVWEYIVAHDLYH